VLDRFVEPDGVAYQELLATTEARFELESYLELLGRVNPRELASSQEKIAFYVNLYNATVLARVLDEVQELPGFRVDLDGFAFFDQAYVVIDGRIVSLNILEHALVRGDLGHGSASVSALAVADESWARELNEDLWGDEPFDPRLHFLLNCASASCPALQTVPVTGLTLDEAAESATEAFLEDPVRGSGPDGISLLFQWFEGDFSAAGHQSAESFISQYRDVSEVALDQWLPYDWSLNASESP